MDENDQLDDQVRVLVELLLLLDVEASVEDDESYEVVT